MVSTRALASTDIGNLNQFQTNATIKNIAQGLAGGYGAAIEGRVKRDRLAGFKGVLDDRLKQLEARFTNPNLSQDERMAAQDELTRIKMLTGTTDVLNLDDALKNYSNLYEKFSDPRKLANELRKAQITGQYNVAAAEAYGQGKNDIFAGLPTNFSSTTDTNAESTLNPGTSNPIGDAIRKLLETTFR